MKKLLPIAFALISGPALAQTVSPAPAPVALVCAYSSSPASPTDGRFYFVQCDSTGKLLTASSGIVPNTTAMACGTAGAVAYSDGTKIQCGNHIQVSANTLTMLSGTTSQTMTIYRSYTDASNYSRINIGYNATYAAIGIYGDMAGTGLGAFNIGPLVTQNLNFITGGGVRWLVRYDGHFLASNDNTFDIGSPGAQRPRALYLAGGITHGSTTLLTTTVALTNGAGAGAGTITNAPAAGNPTKWIPINDNGTTRYIPAW